jgi:hypothetical protein
VYKLEAYRFRQLVFAFVGIVVVNKIINKLGDLGKILGRVLGGIFGEAFRKSLSQE